MSKILSEDFKEMVSNVEDIDGGFLSLGSSAYEILSEEKWLTRGCPPVFCFYVDRMLPETNYRILIISRGIKCPVDGVEEIIKPNYLFLGEGGTDSILFDASLLARSEDWQKNNSVVWVFPEKVFSSSFERKFKVCLSFLDGTCDYEISFNIVKV